MELSVVQTTLLALLIAVVLFLPLTVHKVEENLEAFLFLCGVFAVTVSKVWSGHLVLTALEDPIKITLAVLVAGLLFRKFNKNIQKLTQKAVNVLVHQLLKLLAVGPVEPLFQRGARVDPHQEKVFEGAFGISVHPAFADHPLGAPLQHPFEQLGNVREMIVKGLPGDMTFLHNVLHGQAPSLVFL